MGTKAPYLWLGLIALSFFSGSFAGADQKRLSPDSSGVMASDCRNFIAYVSARAADAKLDLDETQVGSALRCQGFLAGLVAGAQATEAMKGACWTTGVSHFELANQFIASIRSGVVEEEQDLTIGAIAVALELRGNTVGGCP